MKVYVPRKSFGWLSLIISVFPLLLLGSSTVYLYSATGNAALLITAFPLLGFGVPSLIILFGLRRMRYELDGEKLVIKCPPFLNYVVPLSSIKRVSKRDLRISLWSSFRLPGLALFTVPYVDVGRVKMCATSASRGIILIETDRDIYGVTPLDEEAFIFDLKQRLRY